MTVAEVNVPVAVLIWVMIVPMLLNVDFGALQGVAEQWRDIAVTVGVNWLVKPFSMAALGWLFVGWLFRPWLPTGQIDSYIAGLILRERNPQRRVDGNDPRLLDLGGAPATLFSPGPLS